MLKNILIKCANLIGRDDIISELNNSKSTQDITDKSIKNEVEKLLTFYNFIISATFEQYLDLIFCEKLTADSNSKIDFYKFSKFPIKIIKIEDESYNNVRFALKTNFILLNNNNKSFFVTYKYLPNEVNDLSSDVDYLDVKTKRIICYGIISEYLASKGKYSESEFWNNKFLFELFKIKNNKERRLKSTFCL